MRLWLGLWLCLGSAATGSRLLHHSNDVESHKTGQLRWRDASELWKKRYNETMAKFNGHYVLRHPPSNRTPDFTAGSMSTSSNYSSNNNTWFVYNISSRSGGAVVRVSNQSSSSTDQLPSVLWSGINESINESVNETKPLAAPIFPNITILHTLTLRDNNIPQHTLSNASANTSTTSPGLHGFIPRQTLHPHHPSILAAQRNNTAKPNDTTTKIPSYTESETSTSKQEEVSYIPGGPPYQFTQTAPPRNIPKTPLTPPWMRQLVSNFNESSRSAVEKKPYLQVELSNCPKLHGDLALTCNLENVREFPENLTLSWKKLSFQTGSPRPIILSENSSLRGLDPRFTLERAKSMARIRLWGFTPSDGGVYRCEASVGGATVASDITVKMCK